MKETDPRITEFTNEFFRNYEHKYKVKPVWNGKHGMHVKRMFSYCDMNRIELSELYSCLLWFFSSNDEFVLKTNHEVVYFANNISKMIIKYREAFKKPAMTVEETYKKFEEMEHVENYDERSIKRHIIDRYRSPEEFVKMMRFARSLSAVESKSGRIYEHYKRWWLVGYEVFGKDTLKVLWEPVVDRPDLSKQIEKAKEIERKPLQSMKHTFTPVGDVIESMRRK